jgi:hypothetical protein
VGVQSPCIQDSCASKIKSDGTPTRGVATDLSLMKDLVEADL